MQRRRKKWQQIKKINPGHREAVAQCERFTRIEGNEMGKRWKDDACDRVLGSRPALRITPKNTWKMRSTGPNRLDDEDQMQFFGCWLLYLGNRGFSLGRDTSGAWSGRSHQLVAGLLAHDRSGSRVEVPGLAAAVEGVG